MNWLRCWLVGHTVNEVIVEWPVGVKPHSGGKASAIAACGCGHTWLLFYEKNTALRYYPQYSPQEPKT